MKTDDELFAERIGTRLREQPKFRRDFVERVMQKVSAGPSLHGFQSSRNSPGLLRTVLQPRRVFLSPLPAAAAAGILLLAGYSLAQLESRLPSVGVNVHSARADSVRLVQFVFVARDAQTVSLVGDFNNWDKSATHLQREGDQGLWTTSVALPHGRHQYAFMVDGERWMADPSAPVAVESSYGTPNSVVTVSPDAL